MACYLSVHFVSTSACSYLPAQGDAIFSQRSEPFGGSMQVAIIADDLTGAADTGVQLAHAGYRSAVAFRDAPIPPADDLDAVALDTDSRAIPAGFAAKRVMEAVRSVRDIPIVYKKLDSTLRGPIAAELAAALGASGRHRAHHGGRRTARARRARARDRGERRPAHPGPGRPRPYSARRRVPLGCLLEHRRPRPPRHGPPGARGSPVPRGRRGARRAPRGARAGCAGPIRGALGRVGRPRRRARPRIPRPAHWYDALCQD